MDDFHCSFCGKRRREVRKLISGPRVFICDQCVTLCNDILAKEEASGDESAALSEAMRDGFPTSARTLRDRIQRYVDDMIAQEQYDDVAVLVLQAT